MLFPPRCGGNRDSCGLPGRDAVWGPRERDSRTDHKKAAANGGRVHQFSRKASLNGEVPRGGTRAWEA